MSMVVEKEELKAIIKESVAEIFEQNRDFFAHVIEEVVEDKLFMDAILRGESTEIVSPEAIFDVLENEH